MALNVYREGTPGSKYHAQSASQTTEHAPNLQLIGTLEPNGTFTYAPSYLAHPSAHAISFSLPLRPEPYDAARALPYFKGLLPEGRALEHLSARLGRAEDDYLGILASCGLDCVGDVIISPAHYTATRHYHKTSLEELREAYTANTYAQNAAANALMASKLSLAGTQEKLGLYVAGGTSNLANSANWYLPEGGAPSNCILKMASSDALPDLMIVEALGMACARACGILAAPTALVPIGRGALMVARFDRAEQSGEVIDGLPAPLRRHQEDFTQALGLTPASKYAELPGGTAHAIAQFLQTHSAAPALDIRALLGVSLFNFAIGNADNHLKNLSLLYGPNWKGVRLAPAYDLVPTTYYARFSRTMGMALGHTRNIDAVTPADLREFGAQLGVAPRMLRAAAMSLAQGVIPALRSEAKRLDEAGFGEAPYITDKLEEGIAPRLDVLLQV